MTRHPAALAEAGTMLRYFALLSAGFGAGASIGFALAMVAGMGRLRGAEEAT